MQEISRENNQGKQQIKLPLFSCGKISKYFFMPLMLPIICIAYNYVVLQFVDYTWKDVKKVKFYLSKIALIIRIFEGSLYFVINKNNKKENQIKSSKDEISSSLIYNDNNIDIEEKKFTKALKIMSIVSIFELYVLEFNFLTIDLNPSFQFDFKPFYLIIVVFLSSKILGTKIFLHHKIFLLFSGLGLFIVNLSILLYTDTIKNFNWYLILMGFFSSIFYSLTIVSHKYLMRDLFISPLLILFISGLISLFYDFIFNIFYNLITGESLKNIFINVTSLINEENMKKCIIYLVLIVIIGAIYFILVKLTLLYFYPTLLVIIDLLTPLI